MGMEGNSNVSCWKEDSGPVAADSSTLPRSLWITATATVISSNHITGSNSVNKTTIAAEEFGVKLPGK